MFTSYQRQTHTKKLEVKKCRSSSGVLTIAAIRVKVCLGVSLSGHMLSLESSTHQNAAISFSKIKDYSSEFAERLSNLLSGVLIG